MTENFTRELKKITYVGKNSGEKNIFWKDYDFIDDDDANITNTSNAAIVKSYRITTTTAIIIDDISK